MLDKKSFCILRVLEHRDNGLWQTEIHRSLPDVTDHIPGAEPFSLQTVSRRLDNLQEQNHITKELCSGIGANHTFASIYQLTDKGQQALHKHRDNLLRKWAGSYFKSMFLPNATPHFNEHIAKKIFCNRHNVPEDIIHDNCDDHILSIILWKYGRKDLQLTINSDKFQDFIQQLHDHNPGLSPFTDQELS